MTNKTFGINEIIRKIIHELYLIGEISVKVPINTYAKGYGAKSRTRPGVETVFSKVVVCE